MAYIPFIKKKIGLSYLIWLQKGNKYVLLKEPAWFVFSQTVKGLKAATIASRCADRYNLTAEECQEFVNDIRSEIANMNLPINGRVDGPSHMDSLKTHAFKPFSVHRYCFGEKRIDFSFETAYLESYLHPLIRHFEITDKKAEVPVFELFENHNRIVFRLQGTIKGVWTHEETHLVKGLIFINMVNVIFDQTDDFWLMTIHASAISNGQKTILFPASPGSGKTTIAALLQDRGYQMVSDDFVPIDRDSFSAWPFPVALSIKTGSVNLLSSIFPDLEQRPVNHLAGGKSVRYFFPGKTGKFSTSAFPVKEFIFIQYNPFVDFEWEKLDLAKAIELLFNQSWIPATEGNAGILLDQLSKWSFYQLTYSNTQKALEVITQLFDHDQ